MSDCDETQLCLTEYCNPLPKPFCTLLSVYMHKYLLKSIFEDGKADNLFISCVTCCPTTIHVLL